MFLESRADVLWFELLRDFDYLPFQQLAARYYEALYQFNVDQATARRDRSATQTINQETKEEATQRLLFERATMCDDVAKLFEHESTEPPIIYVDPRTLHPGHTPVRLVGRAPKCFFAMFKAFLGVALQGKPPEPEVVSQELTHNPSFARTCGFTLPDPNRGYRQRDIPGLRKLEQFDQIMTQHGFWADAALDQVARNLREARIRPESTLVHDTTHFHAASSMQVVDLPEKENGSRASLSKANKPKKKKRKSHPKTTKPCRCEDREHCHHPWINVDDGAGTVTKSSGMYWAHKASTVGFPEQEILLDAVAMSDAASHDSQSLIPHLQRLFDRHPQLLDTTTRVLDDGAADDRALKQQLQDRWDVQLLASINPRRRSPIRLAVPRGIDHITPTGTPVCLEGFPFGLIGTRRDTERFIFRAPQDADGFPVCQECPQRDACYRGDHGARQITIPCDKLPWIDPEFPQLSLRFQKSIARRTAIERLHKLMKYDFGDDRLTKRGNAAFQARLDKTLLVMHLVVTAS
jgi:hypothetical protein